MSLVYKSKGMLAFGAACMMSSPIALAEDKSYEFGLGIPYYNFDSGFDLDDEFGLRGLVGMRTGRLQFELDFDTVSTERTSEDDVDLQQVYGNVLVFGETIGNFDPFISAGWGQLDYTEGDYDEETTVSNIGAGFKYYLGDSFAVRPSINYFFPTEFDDNYATVAVTFSYFTGGRKVGKTHSASKAEPVSVPKDADNDGIIDSKDRCQNTPAGVLVNGYGCPMDSDNDGIYDYQDECANTPANIKVDDKGCPLKLEKTIEIELKVNFDSNSDIVKPQYYPEIQQVAEFLSQYAGTAVVIEGHTDTMGAASYNKSLSQKRADAVANVLTSRFNVESSRVTAVGYGEEQPIADESTRQGLIANRRVVAKVSTKVEALQAN
ncbi:MAG: OmpA family protein [Cellvibrionaceae bacterium]|nr:OmpA family protein [Cellvibrionaceae bacterium]